MKKIIKKIQQTYAYRKWRKNHFLNDEILEKQRNHKFTYEPKISVVVPLYKTPEFYLRELIQSIRNQTYKNWELCLSDGSGIDSPLKSVLQEYEVIDTRIKVIYNQRTLRIAENTNEALKIATGDFIAFADHDDLLEPNAFYECIHALNKHENIDIIYTDEDKVDMNGLKYFMPHFKSDYNADMLCNLNYFCHLCLVKWEICEKVGFLNTEYEGAQDYDYILRCVEVAKNIKHIPKILYHWRAHQSSTAENPDSKNYAFEAGLRAVQAHLNRTGVSAVVENTALKGLYRVKYILQATPLISIVILDEGCLKSLEKCVAAIEKRSIYKNYEIIIVRNSDESVRENKFYQKIQETYLNIRIINCNNTNSSKSVRKNHAIKYSSGEYILFLKHDIEIESDNCLGELLGCAMRDDVGAVGGKLYNSNYILQYTGILIGKNGVIGSAFQGVPHKEWGYFGRIQTMQNYSAISADCMMVRKSVLKKVNGFEESYLEELDDIDLCMKIREAGYLNVYNPYAELRYIEHRKMRWYQDRKQKKRIDHDKALFIRRWTKVLQQGDPYYNPNFNLNKADFSINPSAK